MRWTRQIRSEAQNLRQPLPCPDACNLLVPRRVFPLAETLKGPQCPIEMTNIWAPAFTKFLTQTTRRVHRLAAILLRRWQAEEIEKTPFPCVSHIWTNDHVWRSIGHATCLSARFRLPCAPAELTSGTSGGRR